MYNDWFTIGPLTIHGYGFMIALGIIVGFWILDRQARKNGLDENIADNIVYVALIVGYLCSKLTYVLINFNEFLKDPIHFLLNSSGWVVFGGILGGILGGYIYCKIKKVNFMDYFNLIIPEVALAQAFGRIGCFFAGCCYGKETHSHFGITFPEHSLAPAGIPLVPTQLISSLGDFCIFLVLFKLYNDKKLRPQTAAWYLILYSIGRFMIEFLRGDVERGFIGILSTSQFISIFVCLVGILLLVRIRNNKDQMIKE